MLIDFLVFILIISFLVVAHEFGHFLAARANGIRVEKFSIGFGPVLLKIKIKFTEFLICAVPLGGYVKMAGDERTEHSGSTDEFLTKAPGIKMRVVVAGPLFNYILAFVLMWIVAVAFRFSTFQSPVVGSLVPDYPAQAYGVQINDRILEVNGKEVGVWVEMQGLIQISKEKVDLKILRQGQVVRLEVPVKQQEVNDDEGVKKIGIMGIGGKRYGFFETFPRAAESIYNITALTLQAFGKIFTGKMPVKDAVAGPIGIYYITSQTIKGGIEAVLNLMVMLNVTLGIVNIFPLPLFDGGHLFFFIVEKFRKKPLSEKAEQIVTKIGLGLICTLFVFLLYNDIMKFGPKILGKRNKTMPVNQTAQ